MPKGKNDPARGTIIKEKGKLYLEVGKEKLDLSPDMMEAGEMKKLVGKKVEILYSSPQKYIIGFRPPRMKPILCYVAPPFRPPYLCYVPLPPKPGPTCYIIAKPVGPDILKEAAEHARKDLLDQLVKEKFITAAARKKVLRIKDILCYYPAQDHLRRIQDSVRIEMAGELLKQGVISKTVHDKIT